MKNDRYTDVLFPSDEYPWLVPIKKSWLIISRLSSSFIVFWLSILKIHNSLFKVLSCGNWASIWSFRKDPLFITGGICLKSFSKILRCVFSRILLLSLIKFFTWWNSCMTLAKLQVWSHYQFHCQIYSRSPVNKVYV